MAFLQIGIPLPWGRCNNPWCIGAEPQIFPSADSHFLFSTIPPPYAAYLSWSVMIPLETIGDTQGEKNHTIGNHYYIIDLSFLYMETLSLGLWKHTIIYHSMGFPKVSPGEPHPTHILIHLRSVHGTRGTRVRHRCGTAFDGRRSWGSEGTMWDDGPLVENNLGWTLSSLRNDVDI